MKTQKSYLPILLILLVFAWACEDPTSNMRNQAGSETAEIQAKPPSADEGAGNNLSFPVIWSDGVELNLRGTGFGDTKYDGAFFSKNDDTWYVQNDPDNIWQAQSYNPFDESADPPATVVSLIDWGDNLEARDWPAGSQIRVETVLYKNLSAPMTGYTMLQEDPNVSGPSEVWGNNMATYDSDSATVYSGTAHLIIQKFQGVDNPDVTWDETARQWTGDISTPTFEGEVWKDVEGPGGYSAEVNVQGKVIYGYNWNVRDRTAAGDYRITFWLDPNAPVPYKTDFTDDTNILFKEAEGEVTILEEETGGGTPVLDRENNLTYIDVHITLPNGKDNPGNGGGKGAGSGNGRGNGGGGNGNGGGNGGGNGNGHGPGGNQ